MSDIRVSDLWIYPIKSTRGISMSRSWAEDKGLSFDRRWMLVDDQCLFVTARKDPKLLSIHVALGENALHLSSEQMDAPLTISPRHLSGQTQQAEVWGSQVQTQGYVKEVNEWFSNLLGKSVHLVYFGEQSQRPTSRAPEHQVAFADGYPILLVSKASLDDLSTRAQQNFSMEQFRPNIVVDGCEAFAEDTWERLQIGDAILRRIKPCSRCVLTTYSADGRERFPKGEPLKTLATYRRGEGDDKNEVYFGQNILVEKPGIIEVGMSISLIS